MNPYTILAPCRWGWFLGLACDGYQTGSVCYLGEWAQAETEICLSFIKPGDTVLDVGANVGNMTLAFARAVGDSGRVIAFEPQRVCYYALVTNVMLNSLVHIVEPRMQACGAYRSAVTVPALDLTKLLSATNMGGMSLMDGMPPEEKTESVEQVRIDDMLLARLDFLKIDTEGYEPYVLRGAKDTIARCRPTIWAEHLDQRDNDGALKKELKGLGYKGWKIGTPLFRSPNTRRCGSSPFGATEGDTNVLAIPEDAPAPGGTEGWVRWV